MWRGTSDAGSVLVLFLRDAACSDNMSDVTHPVIARVSLPDGRFLVGCCRVPSAAGPAAAATPIEGTSWRLAGLAGPDADAFSGSSPAAFVRFQEGRVSGFSGCNNFTGSYTVAGDRLTLGRLAGTMMACPDPAMALERAFHAALAGTVRYSVRGEELTLTGDSGAMLKFTPEPPPRLEGAVWEVTGFNNARHAVVSPAAGSRITLSFAEGTVSGDTGCNAFRASYRTDGSSIRFGPAATTRKACAEALMTQERAFLAALESALTWRVERGVLDMHRADGERALTASIKERR
ncbi:MAG: META domain-containing protein [Burkholderiales bacterium]|nr:META domain-containing protein [Burkholderiales bacterium]